MRTEQKTGQQGKPITVWIPESAEDREELHRLAAEGSLDTAASFGDQPEQRRRLHLLGKLARRLRARRQE